jgi:hypothetical protein
MNEAKIFKNHCKIVKKYYTLMHTELGRLYNIPECCIKQFCEEQSLGIYSSSYRQNKFQKLIPSFIGYVPCDECMKLIK